MSGLAIGLFLATVVLDVVGQLLFKVGLLRLPVPAPQGLPFFLAIALSPAIAVGVLAYALEAVLWLAALQHAPLSLLFPLASLSYCGVALAGWLVLGERVTPRRWLGTVLITLGVAVVSFGGVS
ncbi:EamA family transporter [Reyranella sp. CPCC 100927]|uniref:EamA family transporter n=1 Tax=Reyranella sp. CPCC 100927 TaxID=2599616 RepID=UPI0011B7B8BC|nr:EamA family transporter [Reyranella sp. CPCC 100927]TWT05636.1 EamA family transporter [Reyranella sp. CPCC 100927]